MSGRDPKRPNENLDFEAARARLKGIGDGLGSLFDTVSGLLDEAVKNGEAKRSGTSESKAGFTTDFDMRVRSLDDVIQRRQQSASAAAARSATARPRPTPKTDRRAQKQPSPAVPLGVETHEADDMILIVITLGDANGAGVRATSENGKIHIRSVGWQQTVPLPWDSVGDIERIERPGYLTFQISRASAETGTPD
ncbi:MAG: hypothetical protein AAGF15_04200 [Pseudomonadota bacterium]